jgi:co-chaperonin GroES (HSP10)
MSTTYEPIGNTILVEPVLPSTTISLPKGTDLQAERYKIIQTGDGDEIPNMIDVDDIVILSPMTVPIKISNSDYVLVPASSVIAIVNEDEE